MKNESLQKWLEKVYAVLAVLIIWELMYRAFDAFVIPQPYEVLKETIQLAPLLFKHLLKSAGRILAGLSLTIVVGITVGIVMGWCERLSRLVTPIIYLLYPVPRIAFLPVFMIVFGLGDLSKVILIFAISVFHLIINISGQIKQLPKEMITTVRMLGLNQWQQLKYLVLPAIIPTILTSLKIVLGSSMAALFFAENYATKLGIGYFIMNAWIKADYVEMYSGIVAMGLFGMLLFKVLDLLSLKMCKWNS